MSELLLRGWNVAVPVVDVGDDVFVIDDNDKTTLRVQVKSSLAQPEGKNPSTLVASFTLSRSQLWLPQQIELLYMLMIRLEARWTFLVIPRGRLQEIHDQYVNRERAGPGRPPKSNQNAKTDNCASASAWPPLPRAGEFR